MTPPPSPGRVEESVAVAILDVHGVKHHDIFGDRLQRFDVVGGEVRQSPSGVSGHEGTAVASVTAGAAPFGVAPRARIVSLRARDIESVCTALRFVRDHPELGVRVVVTACGIDDPTGGSLQRALDDVIRAGCVVVAAAGNLGEVHGIPRISDFAAASGVYAVGAYEKCDAAVPTVSPRDRVHTWSSWVADPRAERGPSFLCAFGPHLVAGRDPRSTSDRANAAGTSMAAAQAAGIVASWFGRGLDACAVRALLEDPSIYVRVLDADRSKNTEAPDGAQGRGALCPQRALAAIERREAHALAELSARGARSMA